jgi:hypothetical protein
MSQRHMPTDAPIAIGGVGGSGTRVVAEILREAGFHMGADRNSACDNLWFTLLFKRMEALDLSEQHFGELVDILRWAMTGAPSAPHGMIERLEKLGAIDRPQHKSEWLLERAASLAAAKGMPDNCCRWGWKEPNTHVFISRLWQHLPELKYVHVVRHGLDMAYSKNQNQLHLWGSYFLGSPGEDSLKRRLSYWCVVHKRIQSLAAANPERVLWLDYDKLCIDPIPELNRLAEFVGISGEELSRHRSLIWAKQPKRYDRAALSDFEPADISYVEALGYPIDSPPILSAEE